MDINMVLGCRKTIKGLKPKLNELATQLKKSMLIWPVFVRHFNIICNPEMCKDLGSYCLCWFGLFLIVTGISKLKRDLFVLTVSALLTHGNLALSLCVCGEQALQQRVQRDSALNLMNIQKQGERANSVQAQTKAQGNNFLCYALTYKHFLLWNH